jgi:ribose-phosphate pyrophosphokinase
MIVSPDEAGTSRAVYMANVLGVNMGMFYRRRNYTVTVNGENPIVAHEFLGAPVEGKDIVLLDDMISSGNTVLQIAKELKSLGARRIFICATFGLFTDGLDKFDEAWKKGIFHSLLTTNLVYQRPELLSKPYYRGCDLSKFIALIIGSLNHDSSLSDLLDPVDRINRFLRKQNKKQH